MIAQEFYDKPIIRPFCELLGCIPVRRDGHDLSATRSALRAIQSTREPDRSPSPRPGSHDG
jgi:1-acyl-sn-glycerol-3-phosphate acyltransferase